VFSVTMSGTEALLHSFGKGSDGFIPYAGLVDVNGTLYGTTSEGGGLGCGHHGCGTVFAITPSGIEKVLYAFRSSSGQTPEAVLMNVKGTLYGTTVYGGSCAYCGTVFSLNLSTGTETVVHSFSHIGSDGVEPGAGLITVNGTLYGTTSGGGTIGAGTVFSIKP
jgi:uncharacterized repeat protein (TIGR03803 family)